jgi:hypothetical protein
MARVAFAAATACASVICAFTVTGKSLVSLAVSTVIVAVRVTFASPVTGRLTTPAAVRTDDLLEVHAMVLPSIPVAARVGFCVTLEAESPGA